MCGIAGFVDHDSKVNGAALTAANRALAHRGPDDAGLQIIATANGGHVGLANRRLAIIDLSLAGHQPMQDPATGNWIAYNGEVFNFQEVREELQRRGIQFTSHSDTEVVLKAYAVFGRNCLEHFRGMFAFAIWDNAEQQLFLARDRLGKKPLYYFQSNDFLLFASEVRALLATGLIPRNIDSEAVEYFLSFGSTGDPQTLVPGVKALPPGCYLTWQAGKMEIHKYWDPLCVPSAAPRLTTKSLEETAVVRRIRELLVEAINLRLVSDVPVGIFLSGGIDSSVLVAALAGLQQKKINTFSIVFDEGEYSEASFSNLIARRFNTEHQELTLKGEGFLASLPDAIAAMDQPSIDGFNTFIISQAVRQTGLKVALSGQGGDELFTGYPGFRTIPRMEKFHGLQGRLPGPVRSAMAAAVPGSGASDRRRKLAALMQENGSLVHPYFLSRMLFLPGQREKLLKNGTSSTIRRLMETAISRASSLDPVNRVSYLELTNYMANMLLRDTDCMSMAHGLEVRVPFLDHPLVEYLLSIPGGMKVDSRTPKHLLVKALQDLLPDEIVHRPKKGFTLPFEHWLRGPLKTGVESAFTQIGEGPLGSVLNPTAVTEVWNDFMLGRTSWSRPWSLYVLDRWCRKNL